METTEQQTGEALRANKRACVLRRLSCLALKVGVSLETMQKVTETLGKFPGYRVSQQRCSACQRIKLVVRAAADSPRRR
jgi:hypothetical protein